MQYAVCTPCRTPKYIHNEPASMVPTKKNIHHAMYHTMYHSFTPQQSYVHVCFSLEQNDPTQPWPRPCSLRGGGKVNKKANNKKNQKKAGMTPSFELVTNNALYVIWSYGITDMYPAQCGATFLFVPFPYYVIVQSSCSVSYTYT